MYTFSYHNALMNSSNSIFRFHSVAFTPLFLNLMWEHMGYIDPILYKLSPLYVVEAEIVNFYIRFNGLYIAVLSSYN